MNTWQLDMSRHYYCLTPLSVELGIKRENIKLQRLGGRSIPGKQLKIVSALKHVTLFQR